MTLDCSGQWSPNPTEEKKEEQEKRSRSGTKLASQRHRREVRASWGTRNTTFRRFVREKTNVTLSLSASSFLLLVAAWLRWMEIPIGILSTVRRVALQVDEWMRLFDFMKEPNVWILNDGTYLLAWRDALGKVTVRMMMMMIVEVWGFPERLEIVDLYFRRWWAHW